MNMMIPPSWDTVTPHEAAGFCSLNAGGGRGEGGILPPPVSCHHVNTRNGELDIRSVHVTLNNQREIIILSFTALLLTVNPTHKKLKYEV